MSKENYSFFKKIFSFFSARYAFFKNNYSFSKKLFPFSIIIFPFSFVSICQIRVQNCDKVINKRISWYSETPLSASKTIIYHAKCATWPSDYELSERLNYAETKEKVTKKGVFLRFLRAKWAFLRVFLEEKKTF